jgi:hypothetical protein
MPSLQFEKITIKQGKKTISLPKAAFEGLYQPNLFTTAINIDPYTNTIYIQMLNGDGAGAYYVIWKIVNGVYKDRLIAYGF